MLELALVEIGHGRQPDMRMRAHVDALTGQEFRRSRLIEENEGADHLTARSGQGAPDLEAAEIASAGHDDHLDRLGADGVVRAGFEHRVPVHAGLLR